MKKGRDKGPRKGNLAGADPGPSRAPPGASPGGAARDADELLPEYDAKLGMEVQAGSPHTESSRYASRPMSTVPHGFVLAAAMNGLTAIRSQAACPVQPRDAWSRDHSHR